MTVSDRQLLEEFVVENRDLEELESQLAQFNIFEALGAVRQEIRHSDFLSFLLNPAGNHGLGESFLKSFLKRALVNTKNPPVSAVHIDVGDLSAVDVRREWRDIDILIHSPENAFVVAIENKIGGGEHSDQLGRYRGITETEFAGCSQVSIYLTPEGLQPSDGRWLPLSYTDIAELVEDLAEARRSTLGPDILTAIQHYGLMLRRHIVTDSEVVALCEKIYRRHKAALDLIYEHRPDLQADIAAFLQELIGETDAIVGDHHSSKAYIRFAATVWDEIPELKTGKGWTRSGRLILFEFVNQPESLKLKVLVGPGPKTLREQIHAVALQHPKVFAGASKTLYPKWTSLRAARRVLAAQDFEDADFDDLTDKIRRWWTRFLEDQFPEIRDAIAQIDWAALEDTNG